jgi:hypothetical protein
MKVLITVNKTNTGRIQVSYLRSSNERGGIGTGASLPPFNPNAIAEVEEVIRCLGVDEESIACAVATLSTARPGEQVRVADLDVPDGVLRENGFEGVA